MRYQVGDRLAVVTTFVDEDDIPTSPTTLTGEVRSPSGTVTPLTPTDTGDGVVRMVLPTFTEGGRWGWYIQGTAGLFAADQGTIGVDPKVTDP